ncbi:hypothetical protein B9Q04_15925 [Candidatus Marsarchaeota G2 archaeon BE_D]|jgi:hypothetical protein|uniref:Uncharacterized protein n=1 Tax=Candidatus Marsarchaeota G2 archaeon BE_D TaxID=1978158 RepID=A0A2R6C6C3_9ARCH|nr:MAG: hypothetical protein B9Q04_15925 [Candidatus Marsarchaeota G2 archaeon BE_D]
MGCGCGSNIDTVFYLVSTQTYGEYSLDFPAGCSVGNTTPKNTVYMDAELLEANNILYMFPAKRFRLMLAKRNW